ncbi:hypothetical protein LTR17_006913 [Elasticomyces elasticus]|nr:hypothetical protein LTR17_006913 [Elasticomyces elasticus]
MTSTFRPSYGAKDTDADSEAMNLAEMRDAMVLQEASLAKALRGIPAVTNLTHNFERLEKRSMEPLNTRDMAAITSVVEIRHSSDNDTTKLTTLNTSMTPAVSGSCGPRSDSSSDVGSQRCFLLNLPKKVRLIIYNLALPSSNHPQTFTPLDSECAYPLLPAWEQAKLPALLRTSQIIRAETLPLYVGRNVFVLDLTERRRLKETMRWLRSMDEAAIFHMRNIVLLGVASCSQFHDGGTAKHCLAVRISLLPNEDASKVQTWEEPASGPCMPANRRLDCAVRVMEAYAHRWNTAKEVIDADQRVELCAMLERTFWELHFMSKWADKIFCYVLIVMLAASPLALFAVVREALEGSVLGAGHAHQLVRVYTTYATKAYLSIGGLLLVLLFLAPFLADEHQRPQCLHEYSLHLVRSATGNMKLNTLLSARRAEWKGSSELNEGHAVELTAIRPTVTSTATFTRGQSDSYVPTASLPGILRLPPELRNIVYDLTLPDREYLLPLPPALRLKTQSSLAAAYGLDDSYASLAPLCYSAVPPPLLQTCRTVRNDAYPMYFGRNIFVLDVNEFDDISLQTFFTLPRVVKALLRASTATRYSNTIEWLRTANTHAIFCMRNVLVVDRVACGLTWHTRRSYNFAATVDLFPVEEAVQIHLQGQSDRRMIMVTNQVSMVLEEFVQFNLTADMSEIRQKKELIATVRKVHDKAFQSRFLIWLIIELTFQLTVLILVGLMLFGISDGIRHKAKQAHLLSTVLAELNLTVAAVNGVVGFETSKMQNQLHGWETSH